MAVSTARVASELLEPEPALARDPAADTAMTALLDHLAEELAKEYVHRMEKAAGDERDGDASR